MTKYSVFALFIALSFVFASGQTPDADRAKASASGISNEKQRQVAFPSGVDLKLIVTELAAEMDLNVLFDPESFRQPRRMTVHLKSVTTAEALEYILLQERLVYEKVGPKTILVSSQYRGGGIHQIGVGVTHLTEQLAQYFGVEGGLLINDVWSGSSAAKAGLKAGDVIVEVDGVPVRGAIVLINAISDKNETDVTIKFVRDRKSHTIPINPEKGIK